MRPLHLSENASSALQAALRYKSGVLFIASGVDTVFETRIKDIKEDCLVLFNPVPFTQIHDTVQSKSFSLQAHMSRFESDKIESDGENILFFFQSLREIVETRNTERIPFAPHEAVICEITNPYDRKTIITKTLIEMSEQGCSLSTHFASKLFSPGQVLDSFKIVFKNNENLNRVAKVVYARTFLDLKKRKKVQVGLQFISSAPQ
jgi:hypothetical protein